MDRRAGAGVLGCVYCVQPAATVPDADGLGLSAVAVDSREVFDISERMSSGMKPPLGACRARQRLQNRQGPGQCPIVPDVSER